MTDQLTPFRRDFEALTGFPPLPWQERLFESFAANDLPQLCDIPTGLGKTSILAIWALALAADAATQGKPRLPRRLVYVVNRRTVVDQATREVERLRESLPRLELKAINDAFLSLGSGFNSTSLAISTLRGQFADNGEWSMDPARPAVILGTVDMVGSRLLFSGYGRGFKSRPLHAGFLGQDTLLVHDEAHLEPAFQKLIEQIAEEQQRCGDFKRLRVMALTATSRGTGEPFRLTDADRTNDIVRARIESKKGISFFPADEKRIAETVADHALAYRDSGQAILVFLRKVEDVERVCDRLDKEKLSAQTRALTGTMRGLERDKLATNDNVFARFQPNPDPQVKRAEGTVYLICTSAGEVGVDISADHLVCDLTPFDSMAQRFGRVNRYGKGDAEIDVVVGTSFEKSVNTSTTDVGDAQDAQDADDDAQDGTLRVTFDEACQRALALLKRLPLRDDDRYDASPSALQDLPANERQEAFTPEPVIRLATDILFDIWAMTSIRERLPGRPPVAEWLHGIAEWEPPETYVAWRDEVGKISAEWLQQSRHGAEDILEDYPLKPHELLRDRTDRVLKHLQKLAEQHASVPVWIAAENGSIDVTTMHKLLDKGIQSQLDGATVLLSPDVGGLSADGTLRGGSGQDSTQGNSYDVADKVLDENGAARRGRWWLEGSSDEPEEAKGMRLVRTIVIGPNFDDEDETDADGSPRARYWKWYVRPRSADDDGSRTARSPQGLSPHLASAANYAAKIVSKLNLPKAEATAVVMASRLHDLGKSRSVWQRSIGNDDYPSVVLAKSGGRGLRLSDLSGYRHEFGSLLELQKQSEVLALDGETQDLILHLVASHHGRARPHFDSSEAFDVEHPVETAAAAACEVPRRFARLQRKYGRWGLAYLESLVRAADALASQRLDEPPEEGANSGSRSTEAAQ